MYINLCYLKLCVPGLTTAPSGYSAADVDGALAAGGRGDGGGGEGGGDAAFGGEAPCDLGGDGDAAGLGDLEGGGGATALPDWEVCVGSWAKSILNGPRRLGAASRLAVDWRRRKAQMVP